ncbi:MAG: twin-arginine translocase subunit TatC [Corynebacterium sp.]|nr:twin-arginine translocase subunit TatC [Corynebacterium sp.]
MTADATTTWWKRAKKPERDQEMSITEHIQELRRRIIIAVLAIAAGTVVAFLWYTASIGPIPSLGDILREPYCKVPPQQRMALDTDECRLLATGPFDMFVLRLKVSALVGLVFASPVWLYQFWAFITPGLLANERKWSRRFVGSAVFLFVAGALLAYLVMSVGLEFLLTMGGDTQTAALTGERYFNFLLALLLIFGISFEIPLLIVMLNQIGILSYASIKDKRRVIIMVIFIFAAVVTPGQDPLTMTILGTTLCIMVEFALQICRLHDRRLTEERPEWMDLDDETASPMDFSPGSTEAPTSIASPESIGSTDDISGNTRPLASGPIDAPQSIQGSGNVDAASPVSPSNWDDIT